MLMSAVQISDVKQYANVFYTDDDSLLTLILQSARIFVASYTGLPLVRPSSVPTVNPVSAGSSMITGTCASGATITATLDDGYTVTATATGTSFTIDVPVSETINDGDVIQVTQTLTGGQVSAPTIVRVSYANQAPYPQCADDFEDLTVALLVMCNEMYDNRNFSVDDNKVNFVVKTILDSHSVNLL